MSVICESITDRILSTFPSDQYCLQPLLCILEIVESTAVPTACIECTARPRMFINPEFVAAHAETPEKLLMLVMHELHHVILGHTRLYQRADPLNNLVFDAVINAMLSRHFPDAEYTALFTDFYSDADFPACFLRPPVDWDPHQEQCVLPSALRGKECADLAALYQELYCGHGATYNELREAFTVASKTQTIEWVPLLGDHRGEGSGSSSDGFLEYRVPVLLEELRRITVQWPKSGVAKGVGGASNLLEDTIKPPPPSNHARLEQLLLRVGSVRARGRINKVGRMMTSVTTVVPRADRRSIVTHALGGRTLLYHADVPTRRLVRQGSQVHVYLDVSGSIGNLIGPLYAAVLRCRDFVHPVVHLFSTRIADITLDELRRGVCRSDGGTSIECVAAHMRSNKVRRAVIVTDGLVGTPSAAAATVLNSVHLGVALTPGGSSSAQLAAFTDHWVTLTEMKS